MNIRKLYVQRISRNGEVFAREVSVDVLTRTATELAKNVSVGSVLREDRNSKFWVAQGRDRSGQLCRTLRHRRQSDAANELVTLLNFDREIARKLEV